MSILKDTLQSIRKAYLSLTGTKEENEENLSQQRTQLFEAIKKASEDGTITAAEMEEVSQMQKFLDITDEVMTEIKIKVLKDIIQKALADNIVTQEEVSLIQAVGRGLQLSEKDFERLKPDMDKVEELYAKQQNA
jgi:transcriptional regulator CtsR